MNRLPDHEQLPIERLAASFRNVTNSYKFFWFLAILEHIQENRSPVILRDQLLARMIAWVWYPTIYYKLSFGKQDQLPLLVELLRQSTGLDPSAKRAQVTLEALAQLSVGSTVGLAIREIGRYVPMRFLRPFFPNELSRLADRLVNPTIERLAGEHFGDSEQPCLYRFVSLPHPAIEIHELWYRYLAQHIHILNGYCLWHLLNYLQRNNPNVPNLATKLFEPTTRNLRNARNFWRIAFDHYGTFRCLYSNLPLVSADYTLDHFLPWRFVAHDLLWNIVPTLLPVNSAKSDRLPDVALYWDGFAKLQHQAIIAVATAKEYRLLEDYVMLYKCESAEALNEMDYDDFKLVLHDTIFPQVQVARNMGFSYGWRYQ